jgi:hypothetical protein
LTLSTCVQGLEHSAKSARWRSIGVGVTETATLASKNVPLLKVAVVVEAPTVVFVVTVAVGVLVLMGDWV